jgi:hypothetical protein
MPIATFVHPCTSSNPRESTLLLETTITRKGRTKRPFLVIGVPRGSRTPVTAVKGRCPRPLDDGDDAGQSTSCIAAGNGGARRDRTADLLHAMQALSQLSYGPFPTELLSQTQAYRVKGRVLYDVIHIGSSSGLAHTRRTSLGLPHATQRCHFVISDGRNKTFLRSVTIRCQQLGQADIHRGVRHVTQH